MPQYKSPINGQPLPRGKPFQQGEQQRETARKAGKASAAKRKEMKTLREQLEMLLSETRPGKDGKPMTVQAGITAALVKSALDGNTKAYEIIQNTMGQKPAENIIIQSADFSELDSIKSELMRQ